MDHYTLLNDDCLAALKNVPNCSIDSIITDPPYGLRFMGKKWDHDVPCVELWEECLRVLKPGGHLLAFAGTRTQHRMAVNIEDAGFEIRDMIAWVYGCLSEDTEVLTKEGWKNYDKAKNNEVLTYDIQNDIYQWEKPSRWNVYNVKSDTAFRIQSNSTDQIVSRGHNCLIEREGKLVFVPAEELSGVERVPTLQDDFFNISEKKSEILQQKMQWTLQRNGMGQTWLQRKASVDRQEPCQLSYQNDRRKKSSMEGRHNACQPQREICNTIHQVCSLSSKFNEYGTKGWVCDGASSFSSFRNWQTVDKNGMCSSYQSQCNGQQVSKSDVICNKCGTQTLRTWPSYQTTLATVSPITYTGIIWCPTVTTGAFVAKRQGKIFITGNSGFPKSMDVSKAIDKAAGAERKILGTSPNWRESKRGREKFGSMEVRGENSGLITSPATPEAQEWNGWGTALKPALEPITVARKPLEGTVAANVLEYGTGGLNIDDCRVKTELGGRPLRVTTSLRDDVEYNGKSLSGRANGSLGTSKAVGSTVLGRWPANFIHDGSDEVTDLFPQTSSGIMKAGQQRKVSKGKGGYCDGFPDEATISDTYGDSGSAARFFYCAKASKKERGEGNNHPTVKPIELMKYLCRLVTPQKGVILDPFMGSGTTGVAARQEGFNFIGIEREPEYFNIAQSRIKEINVLPI